MMKSMDKINQSNVMGNWMFPLDWEVRKSEYYAKRPLSTEGEDGNKENPPWPTGENDKYQKCEGERNVV